VSYWCVACKARVEGCSHSEDEISGMTLGYWKNHAQNAETETGAAYEAYRGMMKQIVRICNNPVMTNSERVNAILKLANDELTENLAFIEEKS